MNRAVLTLTALAAGLLATFASPERASAAAPPELQTLEQLHAKAQAQRAEEIRLAEEAKRNPTLEAINKYKAGETPLSEFQPLVDIIKDSKSDDIQQYRSVAVQAVITRFKAERGEALPQVRKTRRLFALQALDLMRASSKDQVGLQCIEALLYTWYKAKMQELGFKATDKSKNRLQDYKGMKRWLEKGESN